MNPYHNNTHQPYPFTAPPSFQSSTGSSYPSYPPSGYSTSSNSSTYTTNPRGVQVPTYNPTPGAVSQPINIPWQPGTQHWSQSGLTGPEPWGGGYFNYAGGPGSYAPPANPGGPGWTGTAGQGGYYHAPR